MKNDTLFSIKKVIILYMFLHYYFYLYLYNHMDHMDKENFHEMSLYVFT